MTFTLILAVVVTVLAAVYAARLRNWIRDMRRDIYTIRDEVRQLKTAGDRLGAMVSSNAADSINATCIAALDFKFPVFLGGWSVDSFLGRYLIQHLLECRPKCIVELGSGSSTILIARTLQLLGREDIVHIACDHEERYLNLTRVLARLIGLENRIEFRHCPLTPIESLGKLWYTGIPDVLAGRKVDFLLIDGPPGPLQFHSRYPALPVLHGHLAEHCTVVLDDAIRQEEKDIAELWIKNYPGFTLELAAMGHGTAILTR